MGTRGPESPKRSSIAASRASSMSPRTTFAPAAAKRSAIAAPMSLAAPETTAVRPESSKDVNGSFNEISVPLVNSKPMLNEVDGFRWSAHQDAVQWRIRSTRSSAV